MKIKLLLFLSLSSLFLVAQKMPVTYEFGEKVTDKHRFSNLLSIQSDTEGGHLLVRGYYQGLVLKPKGYVLERYDQDMKLISEHTYKVKGLDYVTSFVRNRRIHLLFLKYNYISGAYEYWAHSGNIDTYDFVPKRLLSFQSSEVKEPIERNLYDRNFSKNFSTALILDEDKKGFIVSTHHKVGKSKVHTLHHFDTDLKLKGEYDLSEAIDEKKYAFEQVVFSKDHAAAYLVGKVHFKKKRFKVDERRFQYEMVKLSADDISSTNFDIQYKYSDALYPMFKGDKLVCIGFYSDRRDNRYNGLSFFELDPISLFILKKKYNEFSEQFMLDKFGKEDEKDVKNLIFKGAYLTDDQSLIFNAEEYFVTKSIEHTGTGQRLTKRRYHYNDIVSAKLDAKGQLVWARNINKAEVTQRDGAYVSYSSYIKDGTTYFFICSAANNPQLINNERLLFKQGLSRNRNVFLISINENGRMGYEKIIDAYEARLPLMVSKPSKDKEFNEVLFYAKQGSKKQLVKIQFEDE